MAAQGTIELRDLNGNTITADMIQGGERIIAIVTPPDGYEFDRWVDNAGNTITMGIEQYSGTNEFMITVECGMLYKVIFKKVGDDTCSVDWAIVLNNGIDTTDCYDCGLVTVSEYYCNGQATVEYNENSDCCYEFEKWEDGGGTIPNPRIVGVTTGSHITYTAVVRPKVYTINVSANDPAMGTLYIGPVDGSYMSDSSYERRCKEEFLLKAVPNDGYMFEGWPDLEESDSNYSTNPRVVEFDCAEVYGGFKKSALTEYVANFKPTEKYTIRYHSNNEAAEVSNDLHPYSVGDKFVTKPSNTFGYAYHTFVGWTFDATSSDIYGSGIEIELTNNIAALADSNNVIHMYAIWGDAQVSKVTYNIDTADAGTCPDSQDAPVGDTIILNDGDGITKTGMRLIGWSTTKEGDGTVYGLSSSYIMGVEDVTLYACWSALYTVEYDPNGGEGSNIIDNNHGAGYSINDNYTVYSNAETGYTRVHYTFLGWSTDPTLTDPEYIPGEAYIIADNVILYAIWREDVSATLTLKDSVDPNLDYKEYNTYVGETITLDYIPVRTHYVFQGWTSSGSDMEPEYGIGDAYTLLTVSDVLYALWAPEPIYTVTYVGNGSTSGSVEDENEYYAGDTATILGVGDLVKEESPYDCTFDKWYTNAQGTGTGYEEGDEITISKNVILYAKWNCCPVTFAVNSSVYGSLTVNGTTVTNQASFNYEDESQISVEVHPASGYVFIGWVDNATGLYIVPEDDGECATTLADTTRYAYVPVTPATTPTYTATAITAPTYATASEYTNNNIVFNATTAQYYQCIDLSLVSCPVEMSCGGTYIAKFVPCEYGELTLCGHCDNGYEYVESDPLYVYESIDDAISTLTPTNWRGNGTELPSPVGATDPMYFDVVTGTSTATHAYYHKVYSNGAYSYETTTEEMYLAEPEAGEDTPDYVYDSTANHYYYKIEYDGSNVTNVTKAYTSIPSEYLGDIIAWYDNTVDFGAYYNYAHATSAYNRYYEWDFSTNGYTLIPTTHSYEYSNSQMVIDTVFLQTQYLNYTYITINGDAYKWNGSMYEQTTDTPSSPYVFATVGEFISTYQRTDTATNRPILSYFRKNLDGVTGTTVWAVRWDGTAYVTTSVIPVFRYSNDFTQTSDYMGELESMFPIDTFGIHATSTTVGELRRFGDKLNFNNNRFEWNDTDKEYNVTTAWPFSDAHANVYSDVPCNATATTPDTFIGSYILYDGKLMKLRYCFNNSCLCNMYYEDTYYTISRNNIIGTTGTSTDGLYATTRDDNDAPTAMAVSPTNHIDATYGTPTQNDPDHVLVESTYYLGGKSQTATEISYSVEYPNLVAGDKVDIDVQYGDIPAWRARTGLTDGNPTENMYVFPGTLVEYYFIKQMSFALFDKVCQYA